MAVAWHRHTLPVIAVLSVCCADNRDASYHRKKANDNDPLANSTKATASGLDLQYQLENRAPSI